MPSAANRSSSDDSGWINLVHVALQDEMQPASTAGDPLDGQVLRVFSTRQTHEGGLILCA